MDDERYVTVRTYEEEFDLVLVALVHRWGDSTGSYLLAEWIKEMMETRQVQENGDDTYTEAMVKAFVECNNELMYEVGRAFQYILVGFHAIIQGSVFSSRFCTISVIFILFNVFIN